MLENKKIIINFNMWIKQAFNNVLLRGDNFTRSIGFEFTKKEMTISLIFGIVGITFVKLGRWSQDYCNGLGAASWKTPAMLGNSGRGAIYPYRKRPFPKDYE